MKKSSKAFGAVFLAAVFLFSFVGCDTGSHNSADEDSIEILGTWHHDGGTYEEKWVISETAIEKYSSFASTSPDYSFTIVDYDNSAFNAGDAESSDCGYAVVQYAQAPSYNSDANGYVIYRWKELTTASGTTQLAISEGYSSAYGDGAPTAADAIADYNDTNGNFAMFSSPSVKQ